MAAALDIYLKTLAPCRIRAPFWLRFQGVKVWQSEIETEEDLAKTLGCADPASLKIVMAASALSLQGQPCTAAAVDQNRAF